MNPFLRRSLVGAGVGAGIGAMTAEPGQRWEGATRGGVAGAAGGMGYDHLKRRPQGPVALPRSQGTAPMSTRALPPPRAQVATPSPRAAGPDWLHGVTSQAEAKQRFRQQARQHHPDVGGSTQNMQNLNAQWKAYQASPEYGRMATASYIAGKTAAWTFYTRR